MQCLHHLRGAAAGWVGAVAVAGALAAGCSEAPVEGALGFERRFNFAGGDKSGWTAGFADYPSNTPETDYELAFDVRDLPAEVGTGKALYVSGMNRSDDLFMFLQREIADLEPNTTYELVVRVKVASDAGSGCAGIGGAPGEAVYLKVGAASTEPEVVVRDDFHTFTADKGQQSTGGQNAVVAGDVANGTACAADVPYRLIERDNRGQPLSVKSNADGKLWVFVGTDSGYEGLTSLYYTSIDVTGEKQ